jgi:hypothetical protein
MLVLYRVSISCCLFTTSELKQNLSFGADWQMTMCIWFYAHRPTGKSVGRYCGRMGTLSRRRCQRNQRKSPFYIKKLVFLNAKLNPIARKVPYRELDRVLYAKKSDIYGLLTVLVKKNRLF